MSSAPHNPVAQNVITIQEPETDPGTFFPMAVFFPFLATLSGVFTLPAIRPMASLRRLWTNYYPRGACREEALIMPGSALSFLISGLLGLAEIKSQGQAGFPFQTHPQATMAAVTSLIMCGLASAAEQLISTARLGPTSIYAVVARLGRICCLCIFVGSLAYLFYF